MSILCVNKKRDFLRKTKQREAFGGREMEAGCSVLKISFKIPRKTEMKRKRVSVSCKSSLSVR